MTTILVTGAGRGIGLELVKQALGKGDHVIAGLRHVDKFPLDQIEAGARDRLTLVAIDVVDAASIARAKAEIGVQPIDVLINNAGIIGPSRQSTLDMDFDGFSDTLNVNTLGPLRVTQAFLPNLQAAKSAKVVTISSGMGLMSQSSSDRIAYRTSKAAVNKVTQGLATDLKPKGIAVIAMHPGWVRTDMGGSSADISAQESAAGILSVIAGLDMSKTGKFINYDGATRGW